jgi:hypothetical protein
MGMSRSRFGLLALCAVVFGVMAFGAAGAQAEPLANWLILMANGEVLTGAQLNATVNAETDKTGILLTKILGIKTEITCPTFEIIGGKLIKEGTISAGKLKFSGCTTRLNGVTNANCVPHSAGAGAGVVETDTATGLIKLHELKPSGVKDETVLFLSTREDMRFALLEMSELCPIGEKVPIIGGEFSIKDCEGLFLKHLVKHLVEEFAPLTTIWAISKTEEHIATIDGSAWAFLTGEHKGLAFAGDPG